ncbi:MAG: glycosyltransferase family 4 protein [Polyangiaceae bacterium]
MRSARLSRVFSRPGKSDGQKAKIAFFILRSKEEATQLTGGTLSNLALLTNLPDHEVLVVLNAHDILAEELSRRGVRFVVLEESELSWRHVRRDLRTMVTRGAKALWFNARIGALCAREGVSVLQCDEMATLFVGPGAKLAGRKLVVAYRNHPGIVPVMRALYKVPTLLADRIVATSELLREAVVSQGWRRPGERTSRIYNGIDVARVKASMAARDRAADRGSLGIAEGEVAIGVIGSIVGFKLQVELLEQVIAPHAEELRAAKARFHFLGGVKNQEYADRCAQLVGDLGLADVTAWPGYVSDMAPWYSALDLVAFPAPEGTARTLLEAAAHGIPSVARQTSKEAVLDGENGFTCAELVDLAGPILRLANDAGLRARMGERGRALAASRFDIHRNREAYSAIYEALIGR